MAECSNFSDGRGTSRFRTCAGVINIINLLFSTRYPLISQVKHERAAKDGTQVSAEQERAIAQPVLEKYEREGSPYYASAHLWDDGKH